MKQHSAAVSEPGVSGRTLDGRYRLEGEIGSGGLGVVYRATHEKLDRAVAVKLLHAHCGDDPVMRARFEREAKALAALDHPNIVRVTDYGVEGDTPYLVMELLEGQSLAARMAQGALDEANAYELALPLLSALAYVHGAGLVHRDVKPGNVFLQRAKDGGERLKLLDFGLAKFTLGTLEDAGVTRSGAVLGTPAYMSPEQASGETADARSDVYAAGVLLLEMVAGRTPFSGDAIDQLRGHLVAEVPKLCALHPERMAHPELDAFIQRALAKRPSDRFADAGEMKAALEALPRPWFTRIGSARADDHARTLTRGPAVTVDMSGAAADGGVVAALAAGREVANDAPAKPAAISGEAPTVEASSSSGASADAERAWSAASLPSGGAGAASPRGAVRSPADASQPNAGGGAVRSPTDASQPNAGGGAVRSPADASQPNAGGGAVRSPADAPQPHAGGAPGPAADGGGGAQAAQSPAGEPAARTSAHNAVAFREDSPDLVRARDSRAEAALAADVAAAARRRRPWLLGALLAALAGVVWVRLARSPLAEPAVWAAVAADGLVAQVGTPAAVSGRITEFPRVVRAPTAATQQPARRASDAPAAVSGEARMAEPAPPVNAGEASLPQAIAAAASPLTAASAEPPETPDDGNADALVRHPDAIESERDELPPPPPPSSVHRIRAPARDPWRRVLPKELKPLRAALARGKRGNDHVIASLRRYNREHPDDVRGHLLLANLYANREWRADALDQYTIAYQIDPSARGAPEMLPALLTMVWRGSAARGASRLIEQAYRSEALPAIARALHAHRDDARASARLLNLRARIANP